jgi:hypothetical protein
MQVSAINSTNFGNGYYSNMANDEIEKAERLSNFLREYSRNDVVSVDSDDEEPKKKNALGVLTSVAIGVIGIFGLTKKGLKSASSIVNNIKASKLAVKLNEQVTKLNIPSKAEGILQNAKKIASDKLQGNEKLASIAKKLGENEKLAKIAKNTKNFIEAATIYVKYAVQKLGKENIVAGAASVGATAYVARTDGNGNGIPDIAEKGVNAYKNALSKMDALKEVVDLVS